LLFVARVRNEDGLFIEEPLGYSVVDAMVKGGCSKTNANERVGDGASEERETRGNTLWSMCADRLAILAFF